MFNLQDKLNGLLGLTLNYYGADDAAKTFKVGFGISWPIVFKVQEDPDDGFRSMLGNVLVEDDGKSIFFKRPLARVKLVKYDETRPYGDSNRNHGYRLVDIETGHIWLEFGTNHYNDCYPYFVFRHMPMEDHMLNDKDLKKQIENWLDSLPRC